MPALIDLAQLASFPAARSSPPEPGPGATTRTSCSNAVNCVLARGSTRLGGLRAGRGTCRGHLCRTARVRWFELAPPRCGALGWSHVAGGTTSKGGPLCRWRATCYFTTHRPTPAGYAFVKKTALLPREGAHNNRSRAKRGPSLSRPGAQIRPARGFPDRVYRPSRVTWPVLRS
jgi:hypothetical protein